MQTKHGSTGSANSGDKCDHCGVPGKLGQELRAYAFATRSGRKVVRLLHHDTTEQACATPYHDKYYRWLNGELAEARSQSLEKGARGGTEARSGEVLQQSFDGGPSAGSDDVESTGSGDDD